jgi:hypothetical protein
MAIVLALLPAAGHDQLWFLLMAQRWLHGAILYGPQTFDSNTPAIVWLSTIPVWLAERLSLPLPFAAKLLMTLLEAAVAVCALRILNCLPHKPSATARWFVAFAFVTLFAGVPARDFGQRDLIAALLCVPYILAASQPLLRIRIRAATILLAAAGICVKPQLAIVPIFVEVTALVLAGRRPIRRVFHSASLLFLLAGTLFLLAIHRWAPLYLAQAIPTTYLSYWAIAHLSPRQLFTESIQLHLLLLVVLLLLALVIRRGPSAYRPTVFMLIAAGLAGVAAYYQQGTGWYYQQLPGLVFLGGALAFELLDLAQAAEWTAPSWFPTATASLSLLAVGLTLHFSGYPLTEDRAYAITSPDPSFFAGLTPGTSVATLTTSVDDAIEPVFRYHLTWAQRTDNLWTLPAILRASDPTPAVAVPRRISRPRAVAELAAQQRRWMVEDFARWHPQLVLVARCQSPEVHCQELEDRNDDLLAFFLADPAFRSIWQHYRFLRSSGDYDAYAIASPY